MKSFADIKRRIKLGTKLLCVENTYRPELNGRERIVIKVQTNAFVWNSGGKDTKSWTRYPKAREVKIIDNDTFDLPLFDAHYVRLKFID